jgi:hypothetical protein
MAVVHRVIFVTFVTFDQIFFRPPRSPGKKKISAAARTSIYNFEHHGISHINLVRSAHDIVWYGCIFYPQIGQKSMEMQRDAVISDGAILVMDLIFGHQLSNFTVADLIVSFAITRA